MKISVLGAGAVGSMLGGLLQQRHPQAEVVLIGRGAHLDAIRRQGRVELRGPWGVQRPAIGASEDARDLAGSDCVLLTVKSQDTRAAMEAAQPYLGEAAVISIQNGVNHRRLAEFVPPERLVMGLTVTNIATIQPGAVELQINGATSIGPYPGQPINSAARLAQDLLASTGLAVEMHERILGMQYNKLVINCLGCASAVSDLHFVREGLFHRAWRRAVARPIYDECLEVFRQARITLEPLAASSDAARFGRLLRTLDRPLAGAAIRHGERVFVRRKPTKFSVRQDLDRHRATEVDFINGEIVRLAESYGGGAPCNALVVELVHQLEQDPGHRIFSREAVLDRFQQLESPEESG